MNQKANDMEKTNLPESAYVNVLILHLKGHLSSAEIPLFRGAVIHSMDEKPILFHNHEKDGYRYAYPLIQYKRIEGKAALMFINQGAEEVNQLLESEPDSFVLKNHAIDFKIEDITSTNHRVKIEETQTTYCLKRWIPLNSSNYSKFKEKESMVEKIHFLEKMLVGNILSFAKGIGVKLSQKVECTILDISGSYQSKVKGISMQCFDVLFKTNVSLPEYIGIGKHASINYGVVTNSSSKKE